MRRLLLAIAFGWLLGLSASTALAEDVDQGWEFSFAPYLQALSIDGEAGGATADVDVDMVKLKLAGGYRLLQQPLGAADDPRRMTLDVYAGGRFWYVDMDVEVRIPPARIPGFTVDAAPVGLSVWWRGFRGVTGDREWGGFRGKRRAATPV